MIQVEYKSDADGMELLNCKIFSLNIVASVAYLLKISNFFIPSGDIEESVLASAITEASDLAGSGANRDQLTDPNKTTIRRISVWVAEPDIILVNDIEDRNTDAILINARLNINILQNKDKLDFNMTVDDLRGHTCKFNPAVRDISLAQILKPTNMAMHYKQDIENRKTKIDMNFNSLVLNVSPASILILKQSYDTFMENFQSPDITAIENVSETMAEENLWKTSDVRLEEDWYLKPDEALDTLQHFD